MNDVQCIHQTYNRNYLQAEYNFAVASAASARRWMEVEKDAEAVRRAVQATAKDTKGIFRFNPGKQRKTFPDYNPYTISRCRDCDIAKGKQNLSAPAANEVCQACQCIRATANENGADKRLEKHDRSKWEHTYISRENNGYVATELERIKEANVSKSEKQKFEKEMRMCKTVADNGHDVEYLKGVNRPKGQTYDICMDGMKADLKCITGGAGNIVKYIKKALTKQGGEAVVLEIPSQPNVEFYEALAEARRKCNGRFFLHSWRRCSKRGKIKMGHPSMPLWRYTVKRPCPFVFLRTAKLQLYFISQKKSRKRLKNHPMKNAISRMLAAIKVECMDEFDRNFGTESFFGRAWQRRKSPINARYKLAPFSLQLIALFCF